MKLPGDEIRKLAAKALLHSGGASHIASIFSVADLIAELYRFAYSSDSELEPRQTQIILSKGHAGLAVYCALALENRLPVSALDDYYQNNTLASGHVSHHFHSDIPFSTGSLGMGITYAVGLALADEGREVFCVVSEGDMNEGSFWESLLIINQYRLRNLIIFLDSNKLQSLGSSEQLLGDDELIRDKIKGFGLDFKETDGHSGQKIQSILGENKSHCLFVKCNTIKGKGSVLLENSVKWHYECPNEMQYQQIVTEIESRNA